jgi:hypothetical protein
MAAKKVASADTTTFTLKFTGDERTLLDKLVAARADDLREATGQSLQVSVASYLRWLIDQDAKTRGLGKGTGGRGRK